ncbi:hypothetical protein PAMP_009421 [Pampus punctatissimus]
MAGCFTKLREFCSASEYTDDEEHIPKGSSVIVRRVPVIGVKSSSSSKNQNNERSDNQYHQAFGAIKAMDDHNSSRDLPFFAKMANLAHVDASEDDKIKAMMNQSAYHSMGEAYNIGKKEKPPFVPQEKPKSEAEDDPVPDELVCLICHDLLNDAVLIPCCGNSYCDDCIRTALLDSEEHVCPTCSQSDVSPDTLTANNFLRRTVNDYKKEKVHTNNLSGTSQSLNPTPMPSSVPTPPLIATQSQPQELHQLTHSQQSADMLPLSQVLEAPTAPPTSSLQPVQSHLEIPDKEAEGKTHDDSVSAVAALSVLVSNIEPTTAPSQLIPLVNHSPVADQSASVSINPQQSSSGPAPRRSRRSTRWDSLSSTSSCPTRESNTQQLPPLLSLYSATPPPPLSSSPHFHTFLSAQQPPQWFSHLDTQIPRPSGAPTPLLCPSTSTIPALIPKEWLMHQRKKKERSPHRGSTHRRSSSRSHSKPSKSKSSRAYSRSSSRSRSRSLSRSQGRSRPRSPYSRPRDHHTRSRSNRYGYKRVRSPTSSSSHRPQGKRTAQADGRSPPSQSSSDSWSPPSQSTSSNINLDGKRKEEKNEKQDPSLQSIAKKSKEGVEKTATGEEEKFNREETEITVNERKVPIREQDGVLEAKIKPDEKKAREMWGKAAFRDYKGAMWKKVGGEGEDIGEKMEDREEEECNFRGARRGDGTEVSKREFVTSTQTPPGVYKPEEELMEGESKSRRSRNETHRSRPNTTVEEGSSTSTVGSYGGGECLEQKRVVKTLEEYTQSRAEGRKEKLLLIQVPRSKWEKEESTEEERSKERSKFKPLLFW